jgi:hypothetical protein
MNTNISYQVKDVLNLSEMKEIKFKLRFRTIDSDGVENYTYEPQTGDYYYHIEIANNVDWSVNTLITYLQTEFKKIAGIANFSVKQFGGSSTYIEFHTNDDDVMIKLYPSDNDIYDEMNIDVDSYNVSTAPYSTFINTSLPDWVSDIRNVTLPTNTFSNIDDLVNTLQNSFDLVTLNRAEDKFTILSTPENKITCFNRKIIKFVDNQFFENGLFSSFFTSDEIIFTPPILQFEFPIGSYSLDDVETVLTANLNHLSSGYITKHEEGIFKLEIKNTLGKKFKILFSKYDSVYRQLGFQNEDTVYLDDHISPHTLNLDPCDAILINIINIPTIINTKDTASCFYLPINSVRGESQIVNSNQLFEQRIKVHNLDLSSMQISLINTEGRSISSDEMNLKMLFRCYTSNF